MSSLGSNLFTLHCTALRRRQPARLRASSSGGEAVQVLASCIPPRKQNSSRWLPKHGVQQHGARPHRPPQHGLCSTGLLNGPRPAARDSAGAVGSGSSTAGHSRRRPGPGRITALCGIRLPRTCSDTEGRSTPEQVPCSNTKPCSGTGRCSARSAAPPAAAAHQRQHLLQRYDDTGGSSAAAPAAEPAAAGSCTGYGSHSSTDAAPSHRG